jgi:PBP1b-binding outer membrane lipoprotein LpoB
MKKLTVIALLAFTSLFFVSCESTIIAPNASQREILKIPAQNQNVHIEQGSLTEGK